MSQIPGDNVFAQRQWKKSSFCGLKVPRLSKWLAAESIPYQSQERDAQSLDFCIKDNHFFQTLLPSFQLDTFCWIFFNRIFCSLSDRINLWGRTNRWSRSDKIYLNLWSLSNCGHETHVHRMKQLAWKPADLSCHCFTILELGEKEPMKAAKSIWIPLSNVWSASNRQAPCINKINWSPQILD